MLIQFSMIILASQLVIAVADGVPQFNIERGCKVDSASAFDPKAGMSATIKRCVDDEQRAKGQLCTGATVGSKSDADSVPPSYVDLLTCLQDQQLARKLPKN